MTAGTRRAIIRSYCPSTSGPGWRLTLNVPPDLLPLAPSAVRVHLHHVGPTLMGGSMGAVTDVKVTGELLQVTIPEGPFDELLYTLKRYSRELHREWSAHRPTPDNDFRVTLELL